MTYTCKRCKIEKPLTEYYKTTDRKSKHKTICKDCIRAEPLTNIRKEKMRAYGRDYHLKINYDLTREQHNKMLADQNHKCAICGLDESLTVKQKLFVDHCHQTNKVRSLLCFSCNSALGLMKESIEIFSNAILYINKHQTKNGKLS